MDKCKTSAFAPWLEDKYVTHCGYLMGATGQKASTISPKSGMITQYDDRSEYTAAQAAKAREWLKTAPYVYDCAGMAEAYVSETLGLPIKDVNTKARFIYSEWCKGANGTNMAKMPRVPGTAVFKYKNSPADIHHIGYLWKPVTEGKPDGDWYIIEAKGVLYGVVRTRLNADSKWNAWGQMVKYFDYDATAEGNTQTSAESGDIRITGGSVNIRKGPGTQYASVGVANKGDVFKAAGNPGGWRAVVVDGSVCWVSPNYSEVI